MRIVLAATLLAVTACAFPARAADVAAGKEKAEMCVSCHGENGVSQTENIPSLAGQPDQFIQWQLVFFRTGTRKNELMQPIVEQLNNDDIRNLGAYFSSLPPPKGPKDDDPDLSEKGKQAAAGRRCASCHTDSYAGNKAVARIAGQREDYLRQGAARLQVQRALRRRHGRDGRGRLSLERRRDHRTGALSRASLTRCRSPGGAKRDPGTLYAAERPAPGCAALHPGYRLQSPRCNSYAFRCV